MVELKREEVCGNCGAPRFGEYCHRCGQHFLERLSLRLFVREFAAQVSFEHGLLHTVWEMSRDPGGVIRRYIDGQRRRYVSPVTYLLFGAALTLLTFPLYDDVIRAWSRSLLSTPADDTPLLEGSQRLLYADLQVELYSQSTYVSLAVCVPFALFVRLLFRRSGISIAEAAVFALFVIGHTTLVQALISPLLYNVMPDITIASAISFVPLTAIMSMAAAGFFGSPLRSILKVILAMLLSYVVAGLVLSGGLMAYITLFR